MAVGGLSPSVDLEDIEGRWEISFRGLSPTIEGAIVLAMDMDRLWSTVAVVVEEAMLMVRVAAPGEGAVPPRGA